MFALRFTFFTGVASLQSGYYREGDRESEWPPHPSRCFMAMVAGNHKGEEGFDAVLRWLETLGAPLIAASDAVEQTAVTAFVPVNAIGKEGRKLKPDQVMPFLPGMGGAFGRNRPKQRVAVRPKDQSVHYIWPEATVPDHLRPALEELCRRVQYVGRSTSLVQVHLVATAPGATWFPDGHGEVRLRVPYGGMLQYLRRRHDGHARPETQAAEWTGYRFGRVRATAGTLPGEFSRLVILELDTNRGLGLVHASQLWRAVRDRVLSLCPHPIPEWISGHGNGSGGQSTKSHMGVMPLAQAGTPHARGIVKGVGLAIPSDVPLDDVSACLGPILTNQVGHQILPGIRIRPVRPESAMQFQALRADTWCRPSHEWRTVSPVGWNRWPNRASDEEKIVRAMFEHCGLPVPDELYFDNNSGLDGVPHVLQYPPDQRRRRLYKHMIVRWKTPVVGPLGIGAERYTGHGYFMPVDRN